jgi:lipid II isoglutaminyl synthase (glutamine-hydrolysing)
MKNFLLVPLLKLLVEFSRRSNLGAGSTWPGHILLSANPNFLHEFARNYKGEIIVVAGTNGKTTTSLLLYKILEKAGKTVIHNKSGANLLNGIVSSIIDASLFLGELPKTAVFEVDENTLPLLLSQLTPNKVVLLNLFRDQLDRYGEVNSIALKWNSAMQNLPETTTIFLNADDPQIAYLGQNLKAKVSYFGIENKEYYLRKRPHAMDSIYCPKCGKGLDFEGIYLAHLGIWKCPSCKLERPKTVQIDDKEVLPGIYNLYNTKAAILVAKNLGIDDSTINSALQNFIPAFGRQETIVIADKKVKIFLSKNPTGFNESLRTIKKLGGKYILFALNDKIPDGRDVSWIWDVDFEEFLDVSDHVHVSGLRAYDLAVRLKYAHPAINHVDTHTVLEKALPHIIKGMPNGETLYVLPTYSAMLEVRKILRGRKIL